MIPTCSAHSGRSTLATSFFQPLSACQELWPRHFSVRSTVTPWARVDRCNLTGWVNCNAARQPTPHLGTPGGRMEMSDVVVESAQSPQSPPDHGRRRQKRPEHLRQSWCLNSRRILALAGLGDGNELGWRRQAFGDTSWYLGWLACRRGFQPPGLKQPIHASPRRPIHLGLPAEEFLVNVRLGKQPGSNGKASSRGQGAKASIDLPRPFSSDPASP